jgi:hypothetical protein
MGRLFSNITGNVTEHCSNALHIGTSLRDFILLESRPSVVIDASSNRR